MSCAQYSDPTSSCYPNQRGIGTHCSPALLAAFLSRIIQPFRSRSISRTAVKAVTSTSICIGTRSWQLWGAMALDDCYRAAVRRFGAMLQARMEQQTTAFIARSRPRWERQMGRHPLLASVRLRLAKLVAREAAATRSALAAERQLARLEREHKRSKAAALDAARRAATEAALRQNGARRSARLDGRSVSSAPGVFFFSFLRS